MRLTKIVFVPLAAAVIFFFGSCEDLFDTISGSPDSTRRQENFWALTMENRPYQLLAEQMYEGTHCVVWAEKSAYVTEDEAKKIANEYDQRIYRPMLDAFGMKDFKYEDETFANIMEFAGWLVDEDDKLTILLLDIQDGFKNPRTDSYTAGYFTDRNFLPPYVDNVRTYSNIKSMIYIDTWPGMDTSIVTEEGAACKTLAHEFQHLINFVTTVINRSVVDEETNTLNLSYMDTWIDEGLSSQAEVVYSGAPLQRRIDDFNEDYAGTIAKGNNFFVWGNHPEEPNAILDDYATVYLFFRWLYLQAEAAGKQSDLFYRIETSGYSDLQAVTEAAACVVPDWDNWEALLQTWLAANYINNPNSSHYGYRGDPAPKKITIRDVGTRVTLYPGEGVYSLIKNASETTSAVPSNNNIRYAGLGAASVTDLAYLEEGALLTFNINTAKRTNADGSETGNYEQGYVTGNSLPKEPQRAAARSAGFDGPRRLDARDLMGRDAGILNKFRVKAKK